MANLRRSARIEAQQQRRIAARHGEINWQNEEALARRRERYAATRRTTQRQEALAVRRDRYAADRNTTQRQETLAGRRERYRRMPSYTSRMRRLNEDCQGKCMFFFQCMQAMLIMFVTVFFSG